MQSWKAILLLAFVAPAIVCFEQTLNWTDHRRGFINGVVHGILLFPFCCAFAGVWFFLILGIVEKFRPGWRNWFSAMLPAIYLLVTVKWSVPSPMERFQAITAISLPSEIADLHSTHKGGGFADHRHTYSFTTAPEETERMIEKLNLKGPEPLDIEDFYFQPPNGFGGWETPVVYKGEKEIGWYFDLVTDKSRRKVFLILHST